MLPHSQGLGVSSDQETMESSRRDFTQKIDHPKILQEAGFQRTASVEYAAYQLLIWRLVWIWNRFLFVHSSQIWSKDDCGWCSVMCYDGVMLSADGKSCMCSKLCAMWSGPSSDSRQCHTHSSSPQLILDKVGHSNIYAIEYSLLLSFKSAICWKLI